MNQVNTAPAAPSSSEVDQSFPKRPWLKSDFKDSRWTFSEHLKGQSVSTAAINWAYGVGDGLLTDARHRDWLIIAKTAVWKYRDDPKASRATSSAISFGNEFKRFIRWCIEHNINSPSEFLESDLKLYRKHIATQGITISAVTAKLLVLRQLWILRKSLPSTLPFEPFPRRGELNAVAKLLGVPDGKTESIKPRVLFELMNSALQWLSRVDEVRDLRDQVIEIRAQIRPDLTESKRMSLLRDVIKLEMNSWGWVKGIKLPDNEDSLDQFACLLRQTYGALVVLIFSFVAFRKHELAYLDVDCVNLHSEVSRIRGIVRKTSANTGGTKTDRRVHPVVAAAIDALISLTERIRPDGLVDLLLLDPQCNFGDKFIARPVDTRSLYRLIDSFVGGSHVNLKMNLRPHMLRRAFCLIYAWRFEVGDLITLKEYLYHYSIEMTYEYVEEWEIEEYLSEAEQGLALELFERRYIGLQPMAGGMSEWISRLATKLSGKIRVLPLAAFVKFASEMVSRQSLRITASPHGYCFMSALRKRHARCSTDKSGPDYANRTDSHCAGCANFLAHTGHEAHWRAQLLAHESILSFSGLPEPLATASRDAAAECKKVLSQFGAAPYL